MLTFENQRVNAVGIEVTPCDVIILCRQNRVRIKGEAVWIVAPFKETRLRNRPLTEVIGFCAPQFRFSFQLHGFLGLDFQMDDGLVRIHPEARDALAALDLNFAGFQF